MQEKREKRGRDGVNKHAMVNQFTRKAQQNERQWLVHALPVLDFQWILFHLQVHTRAMKHQGTQGAMGPALGVEGVGGAVAARACPLRSSSLDCVGGR